MNSLGKEGEEAAASYLRKKGFRILEKNFRTPFGEVDLIARDGGTIVFIEVKTRRDDAFGHPFEAVHARKREKMRKVALSYLKRLREEMPARFDVMSIRTDSGRAVIDHIVDAFEV